MCNDLCNVMLIVAVMPAYNEEKTLQEVAKKTLNYVNKLIIVNDASSDKTGKIADNLAKRYSKITVVHHKNNRGLGTTLRNGFKKALNLKAEVVITIDADGQHQPEDIPMFIAKIKRGYGFVIGARKLYRYPLLKKFGNFFLNFATNFISGTKIKDTESGFRAFSRSALKKLVLKGNGYEIATEIIFEVGRNNISATSIPIKVPVYVKGVSTLDGFRNFSFLLNRRKRYWKTYIQDFKYVIRRWIN